VAEPQKETLSGTVWTDNDGAQSLFEGAGKIFDQTFVSVLEIDLFELQGQDAFACHWALPLAGLST
jgi:hypothetical protein